MRGVRAERQSGALGAGALPGEARALSGLLQREGLALASLQRGAKLWGAAERGAQRWSLTFKSFAVLEAPCTAGVLPARVRAYSLEDLSLLSELSKYRSQDSAGLKARFQRGEHCLGLLERERLVSVVWMHLSQSHNALWPCALEADAAYSYDLFTEPEHRGRGFALSLKRAQAAWLRGVGKRRLFSVVSLSNRASLRTQARCGGSAIGIGVRVGGRAPVGEHTAWIWRSRKHL